MKRMKVKRIIALLVVVMTSAMVFTGCKKGEDRNSESTRQNSNNTTSKETDSQENRTEKITELNVQFGDDGETFTMHLYEDNETAASIASYVGTSDWRLPIYEDDEDADYDVMQYYDIPSSYEIPSNEKTVTSAKAGEVYYSDPNRIVLFYHDAKISEKYTKVGYFDATDKFVKAVEENPVLEGWGNKIIHITRP